MPRTAKDDPKDAPEPKDAPGTDEVQEQLDVEEEKGYRGVEVDSTPNENYTVAGVTSGAPTPETDPEHAERVRQQLRGR